MQPEDLHIDTLRASTPINESAAPKAASKAVPAYESFRQMQLEQEREFLIKTIRECNGSVREAAQKLGLFRTALYNRLNHLGVNIKEVGSRK